MEYNKRVSDLVYGDEIEGFYILSNVHSRTTSSGKPFLSGTISDRSGFIDAVAWDYGGPINEQYSGKIIKIRGAVTEYRGTLQINISRIRSTSSSDRFELSELVPSAPINADETLKFIYNIIDTISDSDYRTLTQTVFNLHVDAFKTIPAAKSVHHGFLSGLLMHTANMLKTADFLADLYNEIIDRDLLLAGTVLHDIGKVKEFEFSDLGLVKDYSVIGEFLGHLILGANDVAAAAKDLGISENKSMLLQHMILSHHGEREFGAAVEPKCAEAELLSLIDKLDSRMEIYAETYSAMSPGEISGKVFALDKKIVLHE